jgi:hypothetical protein
MTIKSWWLGAALFSLIVGACSDSARPKEEVGDTASALISCSGLPEWQGQTYAADARVQHGGKAYQCKPWPYSGWCGQAGYEPGVTASWSDAWILVDTCSSGSAGAGAGVPRAVEAAAARGQVGPARAPVQLR